jgi:hypothetical protein
VKKKLLKFAADHADATQIGLHTQNGLGVICAWRNSGSISNVFSFDYSTARSVGEARVVAFTNVGTTSWTAPAGVTSIDVLVDACDASSPAVAAAVDLRGEEEARAA